MSRKAVCLAALLILTFHLPAVAETGRSIELVLDASGSMNAKLPEGTTRIAAAKAAVANLVSGLGSDYAARIPRLWPSIAAKEKGLQR